jgi:hypothetical protein
VTERLGVADEARFQPFEPLRLRASATALALGGDGGKALVALAKWAESNSAFAWYPLERDPAFDAIRAMPGFQTLVARRREDAASERAALEEMRERGEVIRRPARGIGKTSGVSGFREQAS